MDPAEAPAAHPRELESALAHATAVLIAIAGGRFDVRAPRRGDGSPADTLAFLVNATAEEVERLVVKLGHEHKELERAQAQLLQSAKLAALGRLAGGMAHELNQPLTVIQLVADLLLEQDATPSAERKADLELIHEAVQRMSAIVGNVRAFARPSTFKLVRVPALAPLDGALLLIGDGLKQAAIAVKREISGELPELSADHERLEQVFLNLLTNARDAIRDERLERREIAIAVAAAAGYVQFSIADTGPGISAEHETRIFDPFFTTKPVGQGAGLGLSVSLGIVRDHGGELRHEPVPGGGARFIVRIPVASES